MIDVQIATSTGNSFLSGASPEFSLSVPTGRLAISGGYLMSDGNRGICMGAHPDSSTTWKFKFGGNTSGQTNTITLYVVHVPECEAIEVLRVKP